MTTDNKAPMDINKYRKGLVCLVPNKGKGGITSHEKTLCDCQVLEIFSYADKLQSRLEKCEVLLTKAGTVIGDVPWSGPCKELDVLHSIDDYFAEVEK